nr:hypothetical protein [Actinomycetota bacterium]
MPGADGKSLGGGGACAGECAASAIALDPEIVGDAGLEADPPTDDPAVAPWPEGCARMARASPGFAMARGKSRSLVSGRGVCRAAAVGRSREGARGEVGVAG